MLLKLFIRKAKVHCYILNPKTVFLSKIKSTLGGVYERVIIYQRSQRLYCKLDLQTNDTKLYVFYTYTVKHTRSNIRQYKNILFPCFFSAVLYILINFPIRMKLQTSKGGLDVDGFPQFRILIAFHLFFVTKYPLNKSLW